MTAEDGQPTTAPDISVLLLSWNTKELTRECLDSLPVGIDDDLTVEVIVVDNGSRDGSAEALAERDDITLIANPENRGYAAAVNQAYERAGGEFVLLLNSDVEFKPGSLSTLLRFLRERPDVAGVGPLYLNPDGTEQQHHYRFPTFGATIGNMSRVLGRFPPLARRVRRYRMLDDDFSQARSVEQPSASCLLIRRSALPDDALMDEQFPIYFNDVALAHSLAQRGHHLWMTPESVVVHEHGASTRQLGGLLARQHIGAHVRYLKATEPRYKVEVYRGLVLGQKLALIALRRPGRLPFRDLVGALRGDPGPVPAAPLDDEED
jgi:GT2 family glycosyltransferase